jgi:hypothetical protein
METVGPPAPSPAADAQPTEAALLFDRAELLFQFLDDIVQRGVGCAVRKLPQQLAIEV